LKKYFYAIGLILVFAFGVWLSRLYYKRNEVLVKETQSVVLLEKVRKVCKLVTVEGEFSEIFDQSNIREFNLYFPFPSTLHFPKTAQLHVQGKVLVGFDMEKVSISADSARQLIILSNLPQAQILAIDHELQYKNLDESFFNSFNEADFTEMNKKAKEVMRKKAEESRLIKDAEEQGNQMIEVMRFMVESVNWELVFEDMDHLILPDTLDSPSLPDAGN